MYKPSRALRETAWVREENERNDPECRQGPRPVGAGELSGTSASPAPQAMRRLHVLSLALGLLRVGPVLVLLLLIFVLSLLTPVFFTSRNLGNILAQTAVIATWPWASSSSSSPAASISRSARHLALASVVGALAFGHRRSALLVILAMLATGAAVGLVNGVVYVWGRMPHPFIVTLATLSIARGLAL